MLLQLNLCRQLHVDDLPTVSKPPNLLGTFGQAKGGGIDFDEGKAWEFSWEEALQGGRNMKVGSVF